MRAAIKIEGKLISIQTVCKKPQSVWKHLNKCTPEGRISGCRFLLSQLYRTVQPVLEDLDNLKKDHGKAIDSIHDYWGTWSPEFSQRLYAHDDTRHHIDAVMEVKQFLDARGIHKDTAKVVDKLVNDIRSRKTWNLFLEDLPVQWLKPANKKGTIELSRRISVKALKGIETISRLVTSDVFMEHTQEYFTTHVTGKQWLSEGVLLEIRQSITESLKEASDKDRVDQNDIDMENGAGRGDEDQGAKNGEHDVTHSAKKDIMTVRTDQAATAKTTAGAEEAAEEDDAVREDSRVCEDGNTQNDLGYGGDESMSDTLRDVSEPSRFETHDNRPTTRLHPLMHDKETGLDSIAFEPATNETADEGDFEDDSGYVERRRLSDILSNILIDSTLCMLMEDQSLITVMTSRINLPSHSLLESRHQYHPIHLSTHHQVLLQ